MKNSFRIRDARPDDLDVIVQLCELHAKYEKAAYDSTGKKEALNQALFEEGAKLYCWVLESERSEEVIGYVSLIPQYSTWDADWYLYMDCLYLKEGYRGNGIGKVLMEKIKEFASAKDYFCLQWQTPEFNERAISFYKREGATQKKKARFFLAI